MNSIGLALRNLRWRAGRSLVVVAVLALGLVVYLFYSFFLTASSSKTGAAVQPLDLPGGAGGAVAYFPAGVQRVADLGGVLADQDAAGAELAISGEVAGPLGRISALGLSTGGGTGGTGAGAGGGAFTSFTVLSGLALTQGSWPQQASEVSLDATLARALGRAPGATITLAHINEFPGQSGFRQATFKVTGIFTAQRGVPPQAVFTTAGLGGLTGLPLNTVFFPTNSPARAAAIGRAIEAAAADYRAPSFVRATYLRPYNIRMAPVLLTPAVPATEAAALRYDVFLPGGEAISLVFLFVGLGVFTVLFLSFLERKRDVAILKTIGLDGRDIGRVFSMEALLLGTAGAVVGLILSCGLLAWVGGGATAGGGTAGAAAGLLTALRGNLVFSLGALVRGVLFIYSLVFAAAWLPMSMARAATVNQLLFDEPIRLFYRRVSSYQ